MLVYRYSMHTYEKTDGAGGTGRKLLVASVPAELLTALREAAAQTGTDKAKFVRQAIREKFARAGSELGAFTKGDLRRPRPARPSATGPAPAPAAATESQPGESA